MKDVIEFGDCRETLKRWAVAGVKAQTCITSPPYFGLRDYGHEGQVGLETNPEQYIAKLVEVFRCVRDVLEDNGTLWLNIGDSYGRNPAKGQHKPGDRGKQDYLYSGGGGRASSMAIGNGVKEKDLIGIPWMLAFALRADGWYLRQDIIWSKPNPLPEPVKDRCTKAHEYIFLMSKGPRYLFEAEAMQEPTVDGAGKRNRRSVWTVPIKPYKGAHFATYPAALVQPCILAGSRIGDVVLDPFMGSGTTAAVAKANGRHYIGCELNPEYKPLQDRRIQEAS